MLRIGLALVLCAMIGVIGCSSSSSSGGGGGGKASPIVGSWEMAQGPATLVFTYTADGKVSVETKIEGVKEGPNLKIDGGKQEGTYKLEDKTLTMTMEGKEKKLTVKELTDSKLILASPDGKEEMTFTKKK